MVIALATDEHYLNQTCLVIESVMIVSDCTDMYKFYILMEQRISESAELKFEIIYKKYVNCTIQMIFIDGLLPQVSMSIEHITRPTYYRLLLPQLIKEDKCLYLDSDVLVCKNLAGFYNLFLGEYEMAGVIAPYWQKLGKREYVLAEQTGIVSFKTYVNAGVLLLNLMKMREDNFALKAIQLVNACFPYQDQDIINRLAYGKIMLLPLKYNVMTAVFSWTEERLSEIFDRNEIQQAKMEPYILHFNNKYKPWEYLEITYADKWWETCRYSLFYEDFFKEYQDCFYYYAIVKRNKLWKYRSFTKEWLREIGRYSKVYIYGAGIKGKRAVNYFAENQINIEAVVVSDKLQNVTEVLGVQVIDLKSGIDQRGLFIVATSEKYHIQIRRNLFEKKCYNVLMLGEV